MAPLLGRLGDRYGLFSVIIVLITLMIVAACQALALSPAGRHGRRAAEASAASDMGQTVASGERVGARDMV